MVVVGDDAGVPKSKGGKVGRRGIAGTVLVQKIAGALAATGYVTPPMCEVLSPRQLWKCTKPMVQREHPQRVVKTSALCWTPLLTGKNCAF